MDAHSCSLLLLLLLLCELSCPTINSTQDEPAFCGLASIAMVLNALSIDPKRPWKGSWRWFHEQLLDCCLPLATVAKEGVVLTQVSTSGCRSNSQQQVATCRRGSGAGLQNSSCWVAARPLATVAKKGVVLDSRQ
jgi:hypothetical protein